MSPPEVFQRTFRQVVRLTFIIGRPQVLPREADRDARKVSGYVDPDAGCPRGSHPKSERKYRPKAVPPYDAQAAFQVHDMGERAAGLTNDRVTKFQGGPGW